MIGDVPDVPFGAHPPGQAEIIVHQHLLSQLICALKVSGIHLALLMDTRSRNASTYSVQYNIINILFTYKTAPFYNSGQCCFWSPLLLSTY